MLDMTDVANEGREVRLYLFVGSCMSAGDVVDFLEQHRKSITEIDVFIFNAIYVTVSFQDLIDQMRQVRMLRSDKSFYLTVYNYSGYAYLSERK